MASRHLGTHGGDVSEIFLHCNHGCSGLLHITLETPFHTLVIRRCCSHVKSSVLFWGSVFSRAALHGNGAREEEEEEEDLLRELILQREAFWRPFCAVKWLCMFSLIEIALSPSFMVSIVLFFMGRDFVSKRTEAILIEFK